VPRSEGHGPKSVPAKELSDQLESIRYAKLADINLLLISTELGPQPERHRA
jgi:hypothetical protein